MTAGDHQWVFGYGSLIWRPDFDYLAREVATLAGFERRFWQGSHDHRGVPDQPGRVVTLIPSASASCIGMAYLIERSTAATIFEQLDHREKNGYERFDVTLQLAERGSVPGVVYIAPTDNFAYLGDAPETDIAVQIAHSVGPSGKNSDYLFELANALRTLEADDPHIFALESAVREHLNADQE